MSEEGEYYGIWSGANLIDSLMMVSFMVMCFIFIITRFLIPFTLTEGIIWIFIVETFLFVVLVTRYKLKEKHRNAVQGVKFLYASIWRDYTYYERMLIGVTHWYKIDIDWTDDMLNEIFESTHFKSLQKEIENWAKAEIMHHPEMMPEHLLAFQETEQNQTKQNDEKHEIIIATAKDRAITSVDNAVPYKNFKLEDITDDLKERIKNYNIYLGIMSEPQHYRDQEIDFDRVCLITDTNIQESLKCKPSFAVHEGFPVDIEQCECALNQLGLILPEIPLYYLTWSENVSKKMLENALSAESINYIEIKVLEKFVYTLRAFSQQAAMAIAQEQTKSNMFYDAWDDLLQEIEELNLHKELGSQGINQIKSKEDNNKLEKYKMTTYILIVIIGFLIFMLISFFFSMNQATTTPEKETTASLIYQLYKFMF